MSNDFPCYYLLLLKQASQAYIETLASGEEEIIQKRSSGQV